MHASKKNIKVFVGRARCGKDSSYKIVNKRYGKSHSILRIGFADRIKDSLAETLQIDKKYFYDDDLKDAPLDELGGETPRDWCKKYGSLMRKQFNENIWLNHVMKKIENTAFDLYIITDCRFLNEAECLVKRGCELFYVDADIRLGPLPKDADVSETEQYKIKAKYKPTVIDNNTTFKHFEENVHKVVKMEV